MAQYDINLREYWRILKKRKFIVIITSILLGVFSTFFSILQAPVPLYTSSCSIKFEKETTLEGLYARTLTWSGGDDIETQAAVITGHPVLLEVAKNLGLVPRNEPDEELRFQPKTIAITENLKSKIRVERESYTNILTIYITDQNPVFAQRMANELAVTYKNLHAEQLVKRTVEAIKYIDEQLISMREKLRNAEEEFNRFSQVNQLISIDMQSENLLIRKKEIRDEIRQKDDDKDELETLLQRLEKFIRDQFSDSNDSNFYSTKASAQYQATNNSLVELLLKKETLLEDYTSQHPEVISNGQKIAERSQKMALLLKLDINNINKKLIDLENELRQIDEKTNLLMEKKLEYDRLKREVESFRNMTALLESKNQEALIRKAEKPEEVVIVKPALLPTSEINPPKTVATGAMGVLIGIVFGLVLAFIIETFDTSLGAIEDVEETLGAKVLGVIPHTDVKEIIVNLKDKYPGEMDEFSLKKIISLVSHFAPKSMISESFRALRTNIQIREGDSKIKTLAINSASPQEGKTLVSVNLAISLAQAGLKTLLVGADLRKPMLAKIFGLDENPGLTDIVMGNYPWRDTVKTITDMIMGKMTMSEVMMTPGMDNLSIITSGTIPPNPAELIESGRLTSFIKEAEKEFDIIIFDSTPVLSTADAAILGTKVDGVLIVYRVGSVSRGLLKRTSTQLEQVNCNIVGVILNGMKPDISPDFQDYKYYEYYSYHEAEKPEEKDRKAGRIFSFFRRKGGESDNSTVAVLPASRGSISQPERKRKTNSLLRGFLIIFALACLVLGLLWQNGIIFPKKYRDPLRPVSNITADRSVTEKNSLDGDDKNSVSAVPSGTESKAEQSALVQGSIEKEIPIEEEKAVIVKKADKRTDGSAAYQAGSFPYSLYLGSFSTMERVARAIDQYSKMGLSPYWVKVDLKEKGLWFRVYSSYFKTGKDAQAFIEAQGLRNLEVKKTAYSNLIGTYQTPTELTPMIQSVKEHGYSPYVIQDKDQEYHLFVGAFITRVGAEDQKDELETAGISNRVIER